MLPIEIGCGKIWKMPRGPKGEKRPADIDHAQLVKQYGATYDSVKRRYSPPKASGMTQFDSDEEFLTPAGPIASELLSLQWYG